MLISITRQVNLKTKVCSSHSFGKVSPEKSGKLGIE
jgi:hypothetical protein